MICPAHNSFNFSHNTSQVSFTSNFDNGNLAHVESGSRSFEYNIWTSPDNAGTVHESSHSTW